MEGYWSGNVVGLRYRMALKPVVVSSRGFPGSSDMNDDEHPDMNETLHPY